MREQIRAFVAILLSEEVRARVAEEIARLRPLASSVRWGLPHQLHLTLKFLGERAPAELELVQEGLAEATERTAPFTLGFHGLGAVPGLARPRVFWVGASAGVEESKNLHARVERALARRAVPPEDRPFSPHLTIGRARTPSGLSALSEALARGAQKQFGSLSVEALSLMRSDLSPAGARYTELRVFPFGGT